MSDKKIFITATQVEPDHTMKKKRGSMWCPYDAQWTVFKPKKNNEYLTYPRCEMCGISTEDYWVKMSNKTWGIPEGTMKGRRK
jgi:hypothetical protein